MTMTQMRARLLPAIAIAALVCALGLFVQPAFASTRDDLKNNYQSAVLNYESVLGDQTRNESKIVQVEGEIATNERKMEQTQEQLDKTMVSLYKGSRGSWVIVDLLLESSSFSDAVSRYEKYEKIEKYYREKIDGLSLEKRGLDMKRNYLEEQRAEIKRAITDAKRKTEEAAQALLDNMHSDGAGFHQRQGTGNNCGATAFTVAVNTLLHENRFTDNVAVWEGPGFNGDSTADLGWRGSNWLIANGLFDLIEVVTVPGDIHTAQSMREWLEEGYVVIVSSGPGSTWLRADGSQAADGSFPDGHWIVFYCYDNGVFYANDSSVESEKGAGIPYNEEQMQQWLSGRGNHFAVAMKKR